MKDGTPESADLGKSNPAVPSIKLLGRRFVARHGQRKAEWEIVTNVLKSPQTGELYVWVEPARKIWGAGKWKRDYVWLLKDLPDGLRPNL